ASTTTIAFTPVNGNRVTLAAPIDVATAPGLTVTNLGRIPNLSTGLFGYSVTQAAPGQFQVVSTFNSGPVAGVAAGVSGMVSSLQAGFHQPASAIISRPDKCGVNQLMGGPFIRLNAGDTRITNNSNGSAGGGAALFNSGTTAKSNFAGFQTGMDLGVCNINNSGWNIHAGLMGGFVETSTSALTRSVSGGVSDFTRTSAKVEVPFFGAYAFVTHGDFTLEFNVRKDWYKAKVTSLDAVTGQSFVGPNARLRGDGWSFNTSASYRFWFDSGWYIEPGAGVSFGRVSFGNLAMDPTLFGVGGGAGTIKLGRSNSILARVGVNVGAPVISVTDKFVIVPFAHAAVWHEFGRAAKSSATIVTGGVNETFTVSTSRVGTFGQVGAGLQFKVLDSPVLGFVRADMRFGKDINGKAINAGLRLQF
ncbi:MAG: autotransporter outer membrane beta-barrel domain-containing protein, partial [Beijerinckiaceae bacterium]